MIKKSLALAGLMIVGISLNAVAADEWFNRWDRNHDGHWTWSEFKAAHHDWCRHHRGGEGCWNDRELRAKFDALDAEHHGWVTPEQVRSLHAW